MTPPPRRRLAVLFAGVGLGSTAQIAAGTVSTLAVVEVSGNASLSGAAPASHILGTALCAVLLPRLFARWSLRPGLVVGYLIAAAGYLLCLFALATATLPALLVGMAMGGAGTAANHLSRYAAAESYPAERRARVVGTVVWAGTLGSVVGPLLLQPAAGLAGELGTSRLAGGFIIGLVFMAAVAVLHASTLPSTPAPGASTTGRETLRRMIGRPAVRVALAGMTGGQVVMVMIMTSTPLHVSHHGHPLGEVGLVIMAHTLGMFAFAPLVGRMADRHGAATTLFAGLALLGASAFAGATITTHATPLLAVVLFALGLGWCMTFVSGSSILSKATGDLRSGVHGRADALMWLSGGTASLGSGVIYELRGFAIVALVGLLVVTVTILLVAWGWRPSSVAITEAN